MRVRKAISVFIFFAAVIVNGKSQTFNQPNIALRIPYTLDVLKVEITREKTVIFLTIENRIEGGNFCADRNIFIICPDGKRIKLVNAAGIPVCPDSYKFKSIGEKLEFKLTFPSLDPDIKWIDLIEDCTSNCFSLYGITLDDDLNKRLDEAFLLASKGKPAENMIIFKNILDSIDSQNLGIEGLLYINIINAAMEDADNVNASVWYKRLAESHAPHASQYLKYLNDKGIKY
jgi:hypothetical protein